MSKLRHTLFIDFGTGTIVEGVSAPSPVLWETHPSTTPSVLSPSPPLLGYGRLTDLALASTDLGTS